MQYVQKKKSMCSFNTYLFIPLFILVFGEKNGLIMFLVSIYLEMFVLVLQKNVSFLFIF